MQLTTPKRGWGVRITWGVLAGSVFLAVSGSTAWASPNCNDDRRASSFLFGSPKTCAAIGLRGDTRVGSMSDQGASDANVAGVVKTNDGPVEPGTGQEVDITITGSSEVDVDAVVVAGGFRHNIYRGSKFLPPTLEPDQHYIAPFNVFHAVPGINYWFTCYHIDPPGTLPDVPRVLEIPLAGAAVFAGYVFVQRRRRRGSAAA